jgi:hypothetical protein
MNKRLVIIAGAKETGKTTLANEWALFYNGMERLIPVASGVKKDFDIINEELFPLFNKGLK